MSREEKLVIIGSIILGTNFILFISIILSRLSVVLLAFASNFCNGMCLLPMIEKEDDAEEKAFADSKR